MMSAVVEDVRRALTGKTPLNLVPEQKAKFLGEEAAEKVRSSEC